MVNEFQIQKGFKQTEIGVIPEDWIIKPLSQLGKFTKGQGIRKDEAVNGNIPCIRYGELYTRHNYYIKQYYSFISREIALKAKRLKKGDILFAGSGETKEEIGKCAAFINETETYAGGDIIIFSPFNISSIFLGYLLNAPIIQKQKSSRGQGDAIVHISSNQLGNISVPLPISESEQTAIATALSDTDALIENLEKLIEKKKNIKQGVMQELLTGKKRIFGYDDKWNVKRLGEIGEVTGAGVDKKIKPNEVPVRLVNYLDVYHKDFIYSKNLNHWVTAPLKQAKRCEVKRGDIFFTPSSEMQYDIAISAIAMEDIEDAAYSYHVVRLRLVEDWNLKFRAYVFKTKKFIALAERICEGSGKRYVISLSKFREMEITYPSDETEQKAISDILYDIDIEIEGLEQKLQKYRMIKQGMMQVLLTGKVRLA